MKRAFWILAVGAVVSAVMAATIGRAADKPVLSLTRLDCGGFQINDLNAFSDTNAYTGLTKRLTDSCYLIRHGDAYMLWDTGLPAALKGQPQDSKAVFVPSLDKTIVEQLAVLASPEQISLIGISHIRRPHRQPKPFAGEAVDRQGRLGFARHRFRPRGGQRESAPTGGGGT
jgi:hypothetical protein